MDWSLLLLLCSLLPPAIALPAPPAHPYYDGAAESCGEFAAAELPPPERREIYDGGRIIDITHQFREEMPSFETSDRVGKLLWLPRSMRNGSSCNVSLMKLHVHTGTHVDAPGHFFLEYFEAGYDVDTLDLAVLNGPALLVDVPRDKNITAEVMKSLQIPKGIKRVLFRTSNTDRKLMYKRFDSTYCGFTEDGAKWLVENTDIKLIGTDYLSAAAYEHLTSAHLVLLRHRDIIIVEGLKLENVKRGIYSVHCLPLRLVGAEGSPVRCILIDD